MKLSTARPMIVGLDS